MAHRLIAEIDLSDEQTRWISDLRNKYVGLNFRESSLSFTIGSPLSNRLPADLLVKYIGSKTRNTPGFDYAIHTLSLRHDGQYPNGNVVLIPDNGFSHFIKLHHSIYTYSVEPFMNRDLPFRPFLPNIAVGQCSDVTQEHITKTTREINLTDFEIAGTVKNLTMITEGKDEPISIYHFPLLK